MSSLKRTNRIISNNKGVQFEETKLKEKGSGENKMKKEVGVLTNIDSTKSNVGIKVVELTNEEQDRLTSFILTTEKLMTNELNKPSGFEMQSKNQLLNSTGQAFIFETIKSQKIKFQLTDCRIACLTTTWNNSHLILGSSNQIRSDINS